MWNQSSRWERGLWWKEYTKKQVVTSDWKTKRVREYESGDSKDGEDDKLPCVIESESKGDYI